MSSSQLVIRGAGVVKADRCCTLCQFQQMATYSSARNRFQPIRRARLTNVTGSSRAYATSPGQKLDVQRLRKDVDERARLGFYALSQKQGALLMDRVKANSIAKEFLAKQKTADNRSNVKHLASRYGVSIEDLASLAIVTFRIPDLTDPSKRAQLPPSQHEPLASSILRGCAEAEEPLAIMQILIAIYLASSSDGAPYKKLASLFPQNEIARYRKTLEMLCAKAKTFPLGPEALTLQGLFLEREGKKEKAKDFYTEAVQRCHFKYNPKSRHPLQLPLIAPWNALGYLLKAEKDPNAQAQAKAYFNKGATEGDDPLSCYESAAFEDRTDPNWLQYTSKAAASGHRQATVDLAVFYREASSKDSPILANANMRKALNWLLEWKRGNAATLAREWLIAASNMGHKPSILQLADYYEATGDQDKAKEHLRRLAEPPSSANQAEEWPQLVQIAEKRLAGITA